MKKIVLLPLFLFIFLLLFASTSYAGSINREMAKKAYNALNPHHLGVNVAGKGMNPAMGKVGVPQILASALYKEFIVEHNPKHYFIMDVREPVAFVKMGHIPGAHNIPLQVVFAPKYLKMLPKHRTIISICYVGQWESMAASILLSMGYHVKILRFGMSSWNKNTYVLVHQKAVKNYPLVH